MSKRTESAMKFWKDMYEKEKIKAIIEEFYLRKYWFEIKNIEFTKKKLSKKYSPIHIIKVFFDFEEISYVSEVDIIEEKFQTISSNEVVDTMLKQIERDKEAGYLEEEKG